MLILRLTSFLWILIQLPIHGYELEDPPSNKQFGIIYVKRIQSAKVFCTYKLLQYNIEIDKFTKLRIELSNFVELLREICTMTRFNSICTHMTDEIDAFAGDLERKYRLIESANVESAYSYRKKRDTDELYSILKKTIATADNGYSDLRQSIEEIRLFLSMLEKGENKLLNYVDYINFNSLAQLALTVIKRHIKNYDLILDILINSNYKALIDLISIDMIRNEIKNLKNKMKGDPCELVYDLKLIDIVNILKMSSMKSKVIRNNFSISFKIPTFLKDYYDLIQAIPIPYEQNGGTYFSQVRMPYYLININKETNETYSIPMTTEEKINCQQVPGRLLCFPKQYIQISKALDREPDYFFLPDVQLCRNNPGQKPHPIAYNCHPIRAMHMNQIIQLTRTTYYVYIVKPTKTRFSCSKGAKTDNQLLIKSQIIYHLDDDCSITLEDGNLPKRKDSHLPSLFQDFHIQSPYVIENENLIGKEPIILGNGNRMRNIQPDFAHIQEQMEHLPKIQFAQKIADNPELIAISFSIITILLMITWAIMLYLWQINHDRLNKLGKINETIENLTPILPELNCRFNFNEPYLPPKKRVKFPSGTYDIPKTPAKRALLNDEPETSPFEEIIELDSFINTNAEISNTHQPFHSILIPQNVIPTVQYATVLKKQQK